MKIKGKYICDRCHSRFKEKDLMIEHMEQNHGMFLDHPLRDDKISKIYHKYYVNHETRINKRIPTEIDYIEQVKVKDTDIHMEIIWKYDIELFKFRSYIRGTKYGDEVEVKLGQLMYEVNNIDKLRKQLKKNNSIKKNKKKNNLIIKPNKVNK